MALTLAMKLSCMTANRNALMAEIDGLHSYINELHKRLGLPPKFKDECKKVDTGDLVYDPLYNALDDLYHRGWRDYHQKRRSDPRGCKQWQVVLDLFREHTYRRIIESLEI